MALGRPRAVEHHPLHVPGAAPGVARAAGTAINAGGIQMGAWGVQAFENDDAMDFAADLVDADSLDVVATSFEAIVPGEYLEAPDCCIALAAAEVVAALRGARERRFRRTFRPGRAAPRSGPTTHCSTPRGRRWGASANGPSSRNSGRTRTISTCGCRRSGTSRLAWERPDARRPR